MADVFISYKREERARCERIHRKLVALGLDVWFDTNLTTGKNFELEIEQVVTRAKSVVVLWSPASTQSEWVREEARLGKQRDVLVAIQISPCELPFGFGSTHFESLAAEDFADDHPSWLKVLRRIGQLTGRPGLADFSQARGRAAGLLRACAQSHPHDPLAERFRGLAEQMTADDETELLAPRFVPTGAAHPANLDATRDTPGPGDAVGQAWAVIEASLDPRDYGDFLEVYPQAEKAFEARRRRRRLDDWANTDQKDAAKVAEFITAGAFPALEAAARRVAEGLTAAADRARERALPVGSSAAEARAAAITGRSVFTRSYAIELPQLAAWPRLHMVAVPPGRFDMGSPAGERRWQGYFGEEEPRREIVIDRVVALGRGPVSLAAFAAFIDDTGHHMGDRAFVLRDGDWENPKGAGWRNPGFAQDGGHPVTCVNWFDAQAFIAWLNERVGLAGRPDAYRLPSEAEWEYCARAGYAAPFGFGDTLSTDQANFDGRTGYGGSPPSMVWRKGATPIGAFRPNAFGLQDMHGNVWEWCQDAWNASLESMPGDGGARETGEAKRRVLRGGAWYVAPEQTRSAMRFCFDSKGRGNGIGFRLARTLLPTDS